MPFAGLMGAAGAGQGLQRLIAQRLEQAQFEEQKRRALAQEGLEGRQIASDEAYRQFQMQPKPLEAPSPANWQVVTDPATGVPRQVHPETGDVRELRGFGPPPPRPAATQTPDDVNWVTDLDRGVQVHPRTGQVRPLRGLPAPQSSQAGPDYSSERAGRTITMVDNVIGRISRRTAGFGSVLSLVPETDARNVKADLDALKANIAFAELNEMRQASRTGGALGNVSNQELELLTSAMGALDQGQSPEQLKTNLRKIRDSVTRWQTAKSLYGSQSSGAAPGLMPSHDAGTGAAPTVRVIRRVR